MSILDILQSQLAGNNLSQMSQSLGADEKTTSAAISAALPTLLGALARNSASPEGAESLFKAVNKDHDGSILNNMGSLLGGGSGGATGGATKSAGSAILGHILGNRQGRIENGLSQTTGIDKNGMSQLLTMLAPMVMGALGQQQRQGKLDASGLAGLLGQERQKVEMQAPKEMGALNKLLDTDGDGDVDMGDLASKGMGILGGLLGGKR